MFDFLIDTFDFRKRVTFYYFKNSIGDIQKIKWTKNMNKALKVILLINSPLKQFVYEDFYDSQKLQNTQLGYISKVDYDGRS